MNPEQFQQVRRLLEAALERETSERATFVAQACPDADVQAEVQQLLEAHEATVTMGPTATSPSPAVSGSREGQRLGHYEILRLLGCGGMGSVYLARRADDAFHKHVAIKILRADAASSGVVRRFQREREILAQLEHPHIARLLDAGESDDGLPYFVMEYVEGRSISKYVGDKRLPIRERIELFRQVCEAVEYAHQRRIVHRDLKPGNVLVTAEGQVKLLDFGIARLLQHETGTQGLTQTDLWLMTPEYASPEQVYGEPVGRPSDVYSLGVILFELLTGHRPYRMRSRIFHEVVRVVCEEPPTRPSLVIAQPVDTTDTDGRPSILPPETAGRLRQSSLDEVKRQLSGDIDNIVLKALEKDASRRYNTPHEFSEDLERHLAGLRIGQRSKCVVPVGKARPAVSLVGVWSACNSCFDRDRSRKDRSPSVPIYYRALDHIGWISPGKKGIGKEFGRPVGISDVCLHDSHNNHSVGTLQVCAGCPERHGDNHRNDTAGHRCV